MAHMGHRLERYTTPHLEHLQGKPFQVQAATVRAKMLIGRYATQTLKSIYKPGTPRTCILCHEDDEDIIHLLTKCSFTDPVRRSKLEDLVNIYTDNNEPPPSNNTELTSAILNGCMYKTSRVYFDDSHTGTVIRLPKEHSATASQLCNIICYQTHKARDLEINSLLIK